MTRLNKEELFAFFYKYALILVFFSKTRPDRTVLLLDRYLVVSHFFLNFVPRKMIDI